MIASLFLPLLLGSGLPVAEIPKPPTASPPGVVRIWGNPQLSDVAEAWARAFEARHPGITVELHLSGSDVAMAGLYTGKADIALVGREATSSEDKAFEWIFRYRPRGIALARGSRNRAGQSPDVAVLVHPTNPLRQLDKAQLARVLTEDGLTWSALGVDGPLGPRPVRVYMPSAESGTGTFLRKAVINGDIRLDWDRVTEFDDPAVRGAVDTAMQRAAMAVERDPAAIGFGMVGHAVNVPIRIDLEDGQAAGSLERAVIAYVNDPPNAPLDSETADFLDFARGEEGQAIMHAHSALRALPDGTVRTKDGTEAQLTGEDRG